MRARVSSSYTHWFRLSSAPRRLEDGRVLWDGIAIDITSRKRAEEAHRESEERFTKAFQSNPEGIAISTLSDGRLLEVNDDYLRMTDCGSEVARGWQIGQGEDRGERSGIQPREAFRTSRNEAESAGTGTDSSGVDEEAVHKDLTLESNTNRATGRTLRGRCRKEANRE